MPSNLSDITHQQSSSITSLELCQHPCCPRTQESCSTQELATWCSLSLECYFLTTPTPPRYLSRSLIQFLFSNVKFSSVTFCYVKCEFPIPTLEIASLLLCLEGEGEVAQSCPTLFNSMDCSLAGSFIHGIFQARVLEWVAISFSRESSWPRDQTWVSYAAGRFFTNWATKKFKRIIKKKKKTLQNGRFSCKYIVSLT